MDDPDYKPLTWRQLLSAKIPEEFLDFPVSVHLSNTDEYIDVSKIGQETEDVVLSEGEPYLIIDF